ncbi:MAG TPA: sensor histidine kinase [Verrucomicrobium sp.]|nr:sensor histidine kinase [Verrucomicrobium sp.]
MNFQRSTPWLAFAVMPLIVVLALGWLLLGYSGSREGVMPLPGAAGATVEHFAESEQSLTLSEVKALPSEAWTSWKGENYMVVGPTRVLWARVTLHNAGASEVHGMLENDDYFTDRVEAWVQESNTPQEYPAQPGLSGEWVHPVEKRVPGREIAFPVVLAPATMRVVYLRLENHFNPYVRLVWWPDAESFHEARRRNGLAEGIYFGGLLALLGYNALLWLRLRQPDMGWYGLYLGSLATFMFLARAQLPAMGLALGSPDLETWLTLMMALNGLFLTQFARSFLELKGLFPKLDRCMQGWATFMLLAAALTLTTPWTLTSWLPQVTILIGLTHVGLLAVALSAWRARRRQARFFVLSFGCLFAGSLPLVFIWFFESMLRDAAMRSMMISSALEMLLLSLAVADRFARAQMQLVAETEQRRMIEETYADELEEEVRERTRELQAANVDKDRMLSVIGHDLRGPLTGLMRSAEVATGEFPRDAARTSRALLLLIEDLVLWARLRAGKQAVSVHPAASLMGPAVALHESLAEQADIVLLQEVPAEVWVETDLVLIQTLVRNLLANALKFATTRVMLRVEASHGEVRFTVGNDGPALSPDVAARLAADLDEPVTATSGMGLRLCREICRALGIRLETAAGAEGGTEFSFTLKQVSLTSTPGGGAP